MIFQNGIITLCSIKGKEFFKIYKVSQLIQFAPSFGELTIPNTTNNITEIQLLQLSYTLFKKLSLLRMSSLHFLDYNI